MTEADLTKRIVTALRKREAFVSKIHGGLMQAAGLPDVIGCVEGWFFALEVKLPSKEKNLTKRQAYVLQKIREAGGIAEVVTTIEQAVEVVYGPGPRNAEVGT